jgi:hypothetical protein
MRPGLKIRHFWMAKSLFLSIICYQEIKDKISRLLSLVTLWVLEI